MGWIDNLFTKLGNTIADRIMGEAARPIVTARAYRRGVQPKQLRVREGQYDDNVLLNYTGLIANRIVSSTFGGGVEFTVDGETVDEEGNGETPLKDYLDATWDANRKEILLHRLGLAAGDAGTGYVMLIPGGVFGEDGEPYTRLQLVEPAFVTMDTMPEDQEFVIRYTIQYKFTDVNGKEAARKRVVELDPENQDKTKEVWVINDYVSSRDTGGRWVLVDTPEWLYPFAPIVHWQNLPSVDSCYGEPNITGSLEALQDRVNFVGSNVSKVNRLFAHPMRYMSGLSGKDKLDTGPDSMPLLPEGAAITQLAVQSDLMGSLAFLRTLRAAMFDTARIIDIDSLQDKLGSLTNFGLKVLYQDQISMIDTKRQLMEDALEEINRRILYIGGLIDPPTTEVVWQDVLPVNDREQAEYYRLLVDAGMVDVQTAAENQGFDWKKISERKQAQQLAGDNVGAALLRAFDRGKIQETETPV